MIMVTFRPPTPSDLEALAAKMRPMDILECRLAGGHEPIEALNEGVAGSLWSLVAEVDGAVVLAFGVASDGLLGEDGSPWMLCAEGIEGHARAVLMHAKRFILDMQRQFERLSNVVHADNRSAIRFLKWCGFEMGARVLIDGEPFVWFSWEREAMREAA